jgi:hypothetical protein
VRWSPARHRVIHRAVCPENEPAQHPRLYRLTALPAARRALYAAVDSRGAFRYVGKVNREHPDALRQRISEHLHTDPSRAQRWTYVMVIALPTHLSDAEVREREGRFAALTGYPREGTSWKRPT